MIMTIRELRRLISDMPDEAGVRYDDPNFSGPHYTDPQDSDFFVEDGKLFIRFPFDSPVG